MEFAKLKKKIDKVVQNLQRDDPDMTSKAHVTASVSENGNISYDLDYISIIFSNGRHWHIIKIEP